MDLKWFPIIFLAISQCSGSPDSSKSQSESERYVLQTNCAEGLKRDPSGNCVEVREIELDNDNFRDLFPTSTSPPKSKPSRPRTYFTPVLEFLALIITSLAIMVNEIKDLL